MATYKLVDSEKLDADLTTVADAIRAKTGGDNPLSFPEGMAGEMDAVFEAGKKSEYDAFWDALQNNGRREDYAMAFTGIGWNEDTFKPKYSIKPKTSERMFQKTKIIDLKQALQQNNVTLDTSIVENANNMFADSLYIQVIPELNLTKTNLTRYLFYGCSNLQSVEKIILRETGDNILQYFADGCYKLEHIIIEGCMGESITFRDSSILSKTSILSILNALSATTTGLTVTLSLTAVNTAFETAAGAADGSTSEEWTTLIATKSNWTISLV